MKLRNTVHLFTHIRSRHASPPPAHTCRCRPPRPLPPASAHRSGQRWRRTLTRTNAMRGLHWTRTLLQAKAPSTAADWAHAYAELAKEKDAQLSVLAKKNRILTEENAVLAKEKDALAKEKDALAKEKDALANELAAAISQCTARGCSTRLLGAPFTLVCESLSRRAAQSFCAHRCTCDACSCSGGRSRRRDAAEARSRSRCRARRRGTQRCLSSIACVRQLTTPCEQQVARRSYEGASRRRRRRAPSSVTATPASLNWCGRPSQSPRQAAGCTEALQARLP
jgi:hypothetical protein